MSNAKYKMQNIKYLLRKSAFSLSVVVACLVLFSSCEHKDLCYHHPHMVKLRLEFDWRDAPDANPQGMMVFFYPIDGNTAPHRYLSFSGKEGGEIDIEIGKYNVICYNNDTEISQFNYTNDFNRHHAFTREGDLFESVTGGTGGGTKAPRPVGTESQRVVVSPDEIWGCNALEVEITEHGVSYLCFPLEEKDDWYGKPPIVTEHVITLYPHDILCLYSYEIKNVTGLENVANMCGSLSGMAPTFNFSDESLGRESVTIPFEATRHENGTSIVGQFFTFGHNEENEDPHRLSLYLWMTDGTKYFYGSEGDKFDVTDQVHSAPNKRRVHLIIDGLDLPKPFEPGTLIPSIDDWNEINTDIIM